MTWDELDRMPWWQRRAYTEELARHLDPSSPDTVNVATASDADLEALGITVRTA